MPFEVSPVMQHLIRVLKKVDDMLDDKMLYIRDKRICNTTIPAAKVAMIVPIVLVVSVGRCFATDS